MVIGVLRWAIGLAVALVAFVAVGMALTNSGSEAIEYLALLGMGVVTLAVLAYVVFSVIRGPRR